MKLKYTLIFAFLFTTISARTAAGEIMTVSFRDHAVMSGNALTIKDVVNPDETSIEFITQYGDVVVSELDDRTDSINTSRLFSALANHGAVLSDIFFKTAKAIVVERGDDVTLSADARNKLLEIFVRQYGVPESDIKVDSTRVMPGLGDQQPGEVLYKNIRAVDLRYLNRAVFAVQIEDNAGILREHTLYANIEIETTVSELKNDLPIDSLITSENTVSGRIKLKSLPGKILSQKDANKEGLKLTRNLKKGEILTSDVVRLSTVIEDGKLVTLSYKTSSLNITSIGKVRGKGEVGQIVQVENVDSKRIVTGRLVNADLVEVVYDRNRKWAVALVIFVLIVDLVVSDVCFAAFPLIHKTRDIGKVTNDLQVTVPDNTEYFDKAFPAEEEHQEHEQSTGSLWIDSYSSRLYNNLHRASRIGDMVTILIDEDAEGTKTAQTKTERKSSHLFSVSGLFGLLSKLTSTIGGLDPEKTVDAKHENSHDGKGETRRRGTLTAKITARVVKVLRNGDMLIRGQKNIRVNGEDQELVIEGYIRPYDIMSDNTIESTLVADARIVFTGFGTLGDKQKQGWLTRVLDHIMPF